MPYTRDFEKAKQLLAEADYPDGFETDLMCFNYSPWIDMAMKIKSDLAEIGIIINIVQKAPPRFFESLYARDFQILLLEWGFDYPDPDSIAKPFAHSDSLGENATVQALTWWCNYVNLETSQLVEQAASELDPVKRAEMYKQITDIILDDGPFAILYTQVYQYGVRSEVAEFVRTRSMEWFPFPHLK
jgi:peptide/nickel transport system substrate-binding protein